MYHGENEMISIPKSEYLRLLEIEKDTYNKALELADKRMKLYEEWEAIHNDNEQLYKSQIKLLEERINGMGTEKRERRRYR